MSEEQMYEMYRLLALAKYEERYVIPTVYAADAQALEEPGCSLSYEGGPGMYESGPFGEASGGPVPVAVETFHATHYDPDAGDTCALWCIAIRHAILTGELDVRIGLQHIDADRHDLWAKRLEVAEASRPSDFTNNGWVVEALQGAWSAITTTPVPSMIRLGASSA